MLGVEVCLGAEAVFTVALEAAGEEATTEGGPGDHAEALIEAEGDHLTFFFPVSEVVVILHGNEFCCAGFVRDVVELGKLPSVHRGSAEVKSFSLLDDAVESVHNFLGGSGVIVTVDLVEIDVVGLEAAEAVFDGVVEVLTTEPFLVGVVTHRVVEFGGDDDFVAGDAESFDRTAEDFFADAERVHVGSVEKVDAEFPGFGDEREAFGFLENPLTPLLAAVGHHAKTKAGDGEAGGAKSGVLHLIVLKNFGEFFFFDGAVFDDAPVGFCDVDRGCAFADAVTSVDDEIETAVHGAEHFDARTAGWNSAHVCAGGNQGHVEEFDEGVADGTLALAESESPGIAGELEWDLGISRDDDGEGTGPEAAGENLEAFGDFACEVFDHQDVVDEEWEAAGGFAALGGKDFAYSVEVVGVGHEHVEGICGNGDNAALPYLVGGATDYGRIGIFEVDFNQIGDHK